MYDQAITVLKELYVKPNNVVFARHIFATLSQQEEESVEEYFQILKTLSDCNYKALTAKQNRDNAIKDAFITGLQSINICQRLLENKTLHFAMMFDQARALESAQKSSGSYGFPVPPVGATIPLGAPLDSENLRDVGSLSATRQSHSQGINVIFVDSPNTLGLSVQLEKRPATSVKVEDILQKCIDLAPTLAPTPHLFIVEYQQPWGYLL